MKIGITENNKDEILKQLGSRVPMVLEKLGLVAEGYAKRLCPVDTGRLRNSITHTVRGNTVYIGTNVDYAPYVEMGTSRTRAQPFIRPAIVDNRDEYRRIVNQEL